MNINNSKEKLVSQENAGHFKRPDTATLERPSILDPSYLRKLDMSTISREKLMNIKNLLAKPHRNNFDQKSNGSSYDSILSDTSMNISNESIESKFYIGSDDDTIKKNKKTGDKNSKTNKKKNQKSSKNKNSNAKKTNTENGVDVKNNDGSGEGLAWEEQGDYEANKAIINRTYRIKHNRRQSIIGSSAESSKDETSLTTQSSDSNPSPRASVQKLDTSPDIASELKKDKKCKKTDENVIKAQPKLIVKRNTALNKYSKKSIENLSVKKSKSKERINVKATDKPKKISNSVTGKEKITKENVKDTADVKETMQNNKPNVTEVKKDKLEKVKYETVPRQKKNSEPSPSKQRPTSHRRSISESTKIELESKENTTPKRNFLRKNSKESNSPNVVRKFMDPITGKLRTVEELPSAVKKIKETCLKVPSKGDERRGTRRTSSSSENSPRKSSISDTTSSKLSSNCDINSPRKSIDGYPTRKSSFSETYKQSRKASLNSDVTPKKAEKLESGADRRRSYFESSDTMFSTRLIPGENYEELFKKSDMIPRDDPVNISNPIRSDLLSVDEDTNTNVETFKADVCDEFLAREQNLVPPDNYFTNSADLFSGPEFRSLIVTPTFYSDEVWMNTRLSGNSTGSLKKYKTIECNLCSKQFGTASFSFHEPHCRQRWLRQNSELPKTLLAQKDQPEEELKGFLAPENISSDVPCPRCNNKVPFPLIDIHEDHCSKTHPSSFSTPQTTSITPQTTPGVTPQTGVILHSSSYPPNNFGSSTRATVSSPTGITLHSTSITPHSSPGVTPTMSPSRKPRTVICYLCGREFGKSSIGIHEPQCLKKWHIENDKLPPNLRRPEPTRPEVIRVPGTDKIDTEAMGEAAFKSYVAQLVPCGKCGRKFFPDRVVVHENVCKGLETRK
ncbi:hypothetical protein M8J77_017491 [Diaphorina citri]|nr:hypothetical protein M8J77_017491 [Diaphorina citri]